jgi:16S rRNA (guanine1207-N2)-methyltransferase
VTTEAHYFEEEPSVSSDPRQIDLVLPDLTVSMASDSGVFSADQIDPGTRYLLLEAPEPGPQVADALDLGCGYGPIARVLAHRAPQAHVWAVDVNARARHLATENLAGFHATVAAPSEVPDTARFDLIWSNPPIRIGKAALHALLTHWLGRLRLGGRAILVVHHHLGSDSLQRWLDDEGFVTTRLGSRRGYRLIDVRNDAP